MKHTTTTVWIIVCLFVPAALGAQSYRPNEAANAEAIKFLRDLVRINTANPPGNEIAAANYVRDVLTGEHIDSHIVESAPGRASIIARLKGSGRARPLLLMAHMDVVGVERDKWSFDPFSGEIRDGFLLGRGASDDKAMLAANLEIMLLLKRSSVVLNRDIIFLAEAGEEGTPEFGINYLLEHVPAEIDAEFALNESGDAPLTETGETPMYVAISTAEKTPRPVKLVAKGTPGHGAFPSGNNAVSHLAAAVAHVADWQIPVRLNQTTREFFAKIAALNLGQDSELARSITRAETQSKLQSTVPGYWAMSRTTISPTMLNAGFRTNVVPSEATATLDIRMLPDEDGAAFDAKLRDVINDPAVTIEAVGLARPVSPISSTDNPMFHALMTGYTTVFPGVTVLPQMVPGATDCAQLRVHGIQCYGVAVPMTNADRAREHGVDERITVRGVGQYLSAILEAVRYVSSDHDPAG